MTAERFKAEQDAARKVFEAERALKEQQGFHVADARRRRHVWALELERALLDIEELNDDARDRMGDLFRAQEEQVKTRADATFRVGTMAMDLEAARAELASTRAELLEARNRVDEVALERDQLSEHASGLIYAKAEVIQERDRLLAANRSLAAELGKLRAETAGA